MSHEQALSLIVPVYNEAESFGALVEAVERHVPAPRTLYVIYDFPEDTTLPVARRLAENRPWIRLVHNDLGRGVVNALKKGFEVVPDGPALVVMADLSDDLSTVPAMLERYRAGDRIVVASRYMPGGRQLGGPVLKGLMSRAAGLSLRALGFPATDATNNFRLYDAATVRRLGIESTGGFEVALELTAKAVANGYPVSEVPTTWRDRTTGQSNFRLWRWLPRYLRWYGYAARASLPRRARRGG